MTTYIEKQAKRRSLEKRINDRKIAFYSEVDKKRIFPFNIGKYMQHCYLGEYKRLQNEYKQNYGHYFVSSSKKEINEELEQGWQYR